MLSLLALACSPQPCPGDGAPYRPGVPESWGGRSADTGGACVWTCPAGGDATHADWYVLVDCTLDWCESPYDGLYCVSRAQLQAWSDAHPSWGELSCAEAEATGGGDQFLIHPAPIAGCDVEGYTVCRPKCFFAKQ